MDEAIEKLTLTNASDEALARRGRLAPSDVRRLTVDAVVNTDMVRSVISSHVADALGVGIRNGVACDAIIFECLGGETVDDAEMGDHDVIIGRTVFDKIRNPGRIKPIFGPVTEGCG